jgi:hypothetical protein
VHASPGTAAKQVEEKGSGLFTGIIAFIKLDKCHDHHAADEAFGIYHALNREKLRATIFHKERDYLAFEKILGE